MATIIADSELFSARQARDGEAVSDDAPYITKSGMVVEMHSDISLLKLEWQALEQNASCNIYQTYTWVNIALETLHKCDTPLIITGRLNGRLEMILPFVVTGKWLKILKWVGDSHTNIGNGLFSNEFLKRGESVDIDFLKSVVQKIHGGLLHTKLINQQFKINGSPDPLLAMPWQQGVNSFFKMDLSGGFDALLKAGNAKRKKSRFRSRVKQAEASGGYEFTRVDSHDEAEAAIGEFISLKEQRFAELGISDVFACRNADTFIRKIAKTPTVSGINPLVLFILKIGGKTRAIFAGGVIGKTINGQLNAISVDELSRIGPGELLLHLAAKELAEDGFDTFDLGVGNERYKRSWCQHELVTRTTIVALTPMAIPLAAFDRALHGLKRSVRNNPFLWKFIKTLRRLKATVLATR